LYDEGWLFHGPALQALAALGPISPDGFSGTIKVLPLEGLLPPGHPAAFHTDLIVLDTFTHLLGCWGLDCLERGDVVFPLRMGRLSIRGSQPAVGTPIECRIRILELERHRVRVNAELIRPDGRVWMHIDDWEDWRFDWPPRYRDVFRAPDKVLIGEELPLAGIPLRVACGVWLAPPSDMGRPVWRDVLEWTQLGPEERASHLALGGPEIRRSHRLWGRIAAKEATRRIWLARGLPPCYPADLALAADPSGAPLLVDRSRAGDGAVAAVSIAQAEGVAVALAAQDPEARVGIDVEPIIEREEGFESLAFTASERALLAPSSRENRREWIARLLAAKQAAAKACGIGPSAEPRETAVLAVDQETGMARVELRVRSTSTCPELAGAILLVRTDRRGDHAWAWTLGERTER
jgi:phosphopantetheinyl transferase (holo-ACP synthase)